MAKGRNIRWRREEVIRVPILKKLTSMILSGNAGTHSRGGRLTKRPPRGGRKVTDLNPVYICDCPVDPLEPCLHLWPSTGSTWTLSISVTVQWIHLNPVYICDCPVDPLEPCLYLWPSSGSTWTLSISVTLQWIHLNLVYICDPPVDPLEPCLHLWPSSGSIWTLSTSVTLYWIYLNPVYICDPPLDPLELCLHLWPSTGSTWTLSTSVTLHWIHLNLVCICDPPLDPFSLWCWRQWGTRPAVKNGEQVGAICTLHVLQRNKDHPKKQLQGRMATTPRRWDRRGQHPPAGQSGKSHNL